jgi:HAMP domain-containing protein
MSLKLKFNLVFTLLFAVILGIATWVVHRTVSANAQAEIVHDAQRLMDVATAVREYTVAHVKPHLDPLLDRHFLPETVPAFAATETLLSLAAKQPGYRYREAALNPTNPRDLPLPWEKSLIERFRADTKLTELTGELRTPEGEVFYVARPIQIKNTACLACHNTAETAPASLIAKYGTAHGFGWKLNEVVGAQVVAVPTEMPQQKAQHLFSTFLATVIGLFAALFIVHNVLMHRWVVQPIRAVAHASQRVSQGDLAMAEFPEGRTDEIGSLQRSFNRMRRSVVKAMEMLRRG